MKLQRLLPYLLFAILVCIFLWRPVFRGDALLPGDYLAQMSPWNSVITASDPPPQWNPLQWDAIAQFYPWRVFYARSMGAGQIPLWNPHQFGGTPFLANGQSAVLYPLNLSFLIFTPITAFTVFAALHLYLAQVFTYLLLRNLGLRMAGSIVGAVCFAFSAFMVLWLELPTLVSVAVWLPLVLLLIHRAVDRGSVMYGMLSGSVLTMAFLAGHLQIAFYVALAAVLWWGWRLLEAWRGGRRMLAPFVGFVLIAALAPSAQLLPSIELGSNSHRVREATAEGYSRFVGNAVKPYRLVTAFVPDYYGNPSRNDYYLLGALPDGSLCTAADYMEHGMYVGVLPLLLAGFGLAGLRRYRYSGFFALLGSIAMLIALGTAINVVFYYCVPGFSAFGGPNRILLLYVFSVAVLAGYGTDILLSHRQRYGVADGAVGSAKPLPLGWVLGVGFLLFLLVNYVAQKQAIAPMIPLTSGDELASLRFGADRAVAFAAAAVVVLCVAVYKAEWRLLNTVLLIAVSVLDLFAFGINYNPTCAREKVYPNTALTDALQSLPNGRWIAAINPNWSLWDTPQAVLPPNAGVVYGLSDVSGYDSLFLMSYKRLANEIQGVDSSPPENGNILFARRYTPRLGEIADIVLSATPLQSAELVETGEYGGVYVYRIANNEVTRAANNPPRDLYSFRLGLFLSLLSLSILCAAGACTLVACKKKRGTH